MWGALAPKIQPQGGLVARIPVKVFVEPGFVRPPKLHFSDEEYARVRQGEIGACVDIIAIDRTKKVFYLAMRKTKPVPGWWWFGGRQFPGETPEEAAGRILRREIGLGIVPTRLEAVAVVNHLCKNREQEPQDMGCHMLATTFVTELSTEELEVVARSLEKKEYVGDFGLRQFNREELVAVGAREAVLALYDEVFSGTNETLRRLAAEDGVSVEEFVSELLRKEDSRRHNVLLPYRGIVRKRCRRRDCSEKNEFPPEPYILDD